VKETRFPLVETFGVKGLSEPQKLVIQVVADLVKEGPQEASKSDNLTALCGSHPDSNPRDSVPPRGGIKPVEFTPAPGGTYRQHLNPQSWDLEAGRDSGNKLLANSFCS
jgi:hypothetical protein